MNKQISLIGISGYINSGKDTVGNIIRYLTTYPNKERSYNSYIIDIGVDPDAEDHYTWKLRKFAKKLKEICSILTGVPIEKWEDQSFKGQSMSSEWKGYYIFSNRLDKIISKPYLAWLEATEDIQRKNEYRLAEDNLTVTEGVMSNREFLQLVGTEAIRNQIHPNAWVNALFADYKGTKYPYEGDDWGLPSWCITDPRFKNEAKAIKERGGILVRLTRGHYYKWDEVNKQHRWADKKDESDYLTTTSNAYTKWGAYKLFLRNLNEGKNLHSSETSLDNWDFDYYIENNGTIEELVEEVKKMLIHFNIIKDGGD